MSSFRSIRRYAARGRVNRSQAEVSRALRSSHSACRSVRSRRLAIRRRERKHGSGPSRRVVALPLAPPDPEPCHIRRTGPRWRGFPATSSASSRTSSWPRYSACPEEGGPRSRDRRASASANTSAASSRGASLDPAASADGEAPRKTANVLVDEYRNRNHG